MSKLNFLCWLCNRICSFLEKFTPRWQKIYTAVGSDGSDKYHLCCCLVSIVFLSTTVLLFVACFNCISTPPFYYLLPPDICQPCPSCQPEFAPPVLSFVQCLLHTSVFHLWQLVNNLNGHLRNCFFSLRTTQFSHFSFLQVTTSDTSKWFQLKFAPSVLSFTSGFTADLWPGLPLDIFHLSLCLIRIFM